MRVPTDYLLQGFRATCGTATRKDCKVSHVNDLMKIHVAVIQFVLLSSYVLERLSKMWFDLRDKQRNSDDTPKPPGLVVKEEVQESDLNENF